MTAMDVAAGTDQLGPSSGVNRAWRIDALVAAVAYVIATVFTVPFFAGDTADYVGDVLSAEGGVTHRLWEFGHLLWRPAGFLAHWLGSPLLGVVYPNDSQAQVWLAFDALSWLGGLLAITAMVWWCRWLGASRFATLTSATLLILSQAFLNFSQTGTPYVASLGLLTLALALATHAAMADGRSGLRSAIASGAIGAASTLVWFPFAWAMPALVLTPLLLPSPGRRWGRSVAVAVTGALTGLVMVAVGAWSGGVRSSAAFGEWYHAARHGIAGISGIPRVAIGFPRSFVSTGSLGAQVKRFLQHDAVDPVRIGDLLSWHLAALLLFYLGLLVTVVAAARSLRGRRALSLGLAGAIPVFGFAVYWQGGDMERYLAFFPFLLLVVAMAVDAAKVPLRRAMPVAFAGIVAIVNARELSVQAAETRNQPAIARLELISSVLKARDLVITPNWNDDLVNFVRTYPFHPLNRRAFILDALVTPGAGDVPSWRERFASRILATWDRGNAVWLSTRALAARPQPGWNWVEGDETRVQWQDFVAFASALEHDTMTVDRIDTFVRVWPSETNRAKLTAIASGLR